MAEVSSVREVLSRREMTEQQTLATLRKSGTLESRVAITNPRLPNDAWRQSNPVGVVLDPRTSHLKANHFRVNPSRIPTRISQYHIHIRRYDRAGVLSSEETSQTEDSRLNVTLMNLLRSRHPEWPIGFSYDSRSTVFTTSPLPFDVDGQAPHAEDVEIPNEDGTQSRHRYQICITSTTHCVSTGQWQLMQDPAFMRALDLSSLECARRQLPLEQPQWYLNGNIGYNTLETPIELAARIVAMKGYFVGFKSCMAGLVLVSDMCSTVFLVGGPIMNVIAEMCGYRDVNAWIADVKARGMNGGHISRINETLKNTKLKLVHLGYQKKFKMLGPAANHRDSCFELENRQVTVADYYKQMCRDSPAYRRYLPKGMLQFPHLPTINVGSAKKPVLIPMELINVYNGQNFSHRCTGEMTASLIRHAAVKPDERFRHILDNMSSNDGLLGTIRSDPTAMAFGVSDFELRPMSVAGRLLPPPTLMYHGNQQVEPKLSGSWNTPSPVKFAQNPKSPSADGSYTYGVVVVGKPRSHDSWEQTVSKYLQEFEQEAKKSSLKFKNGGRVIQSSSRTDELTHHFRSMMTHGARFVIVMLCGEYYCEVKSAADPLGLLTSCLRWKTVEDPSRGKLPNILVKLNAKLGGVNHHVSLMKNSIPPFDRLCMLVGIDVSHAAPGSDQPSVAAVVGTIDRQVFPSSSFLLLPQSCSLTTGNSICDPSLLSGLSRGNRFCSRGGHDTIVQCLSTAQQWYDA